MGGPRVKGELHGSPDFRWFSGAPGCAIVWMCHTIRIHKGATLGCKRQAKIRRMAAWQEQLEVLRARVAQVAAACDQKYASPRGAGGSLEGVLSGEEVETAFGRHFETDKLYPAHRRHGSADIGALSDLPHDLLGTLSGGTIPAARPEEWAFLDTETTGLAGGSGSCAFLVGVGRITREGFRVRQFFMRDHAEEASLLDALARHLEPFRVMITYNGRAFDQPLLEARYRWR